MAKTKIEYLDRTWNMAPGCTMVSPGCTHCWAQTMAHRLELMGQTEYRGMASNGHWSGDVLMLPDRLSEPLHWKKPQLIGVNYMGDLFHPKVTFEFIMSTFEAMYAADWHTYFVLTKRPERAIEFIRQSGILARQFPHVLFGSTVENQEWAGRRVIPMTDIHEAGFRTWISYEPALGKVYWGSYNFIELMVAGGESGTNARMMHPDWMQSARDWCQKHGIKFFFKQWGEWAPLDHLPTVTDKTTFKTRPVDFDGSRMCKVGKHFAGRKLDGRTWDELP